MSKYKWPLIGCFTFAHLSVSIYAGLLSAGIGFSRHAMGGNYNLEERLVIGTTYVIYAPLGLLGLAAPHSGMWSIAFILGNSLLWGAAIYRGTVFAESRWQNRAFVRKKLHIQMTIRTALTTMLGTALVCGIFGGMIGYGIGWLQPGAYRSLFAPVSPDFSPTAVGISLGIPQGLLFGAIIGIAAVAIVTWYQIRAAEITCNSVTSDD